MHILEVVLRSSELEPWRHHSFLKYFIFLYGLGHEARGSLKHENNLAQARPSDRSWTLGLATDSPHLSAQNVVLKRGLHVLPLFYLLCSSPILLKRAQLHPLSL